jgi:hypothetical protein
MAHRAKQPHHRHFGKTTLQSRATDHSSFCRRACKCNGSAKETTGNRRRGRRDGRPARHASETSFGRSSMPPWTRTTHHGRASPDQVDRLAAATAFVAASPWHGIACKSFSGDPPNGEIVMFIPRNFFTTFFFFLELM